jgi:hypothetical protein
LQGKAKNQELGQNGCKNEIQVYTHGFSNKFVSEDAKFETEADVNEIIH